MCISFGRGRREKLVSRRFCDASQRSEALRRQSVDSEDTHPLEAFHVNIRVAGRWKIAGVVADKLSRIHFSINDLSLEYFALEFGL